MASPDASGPSGGVPGNSRGLVSRDLCEKYPGLARQIVTAGQHPRAGHDRRRWETVSWDDYRAKVAVGQSRGWWRIEPSVSRPGDLAWWSARGQQMPVTPPGLYASLVHQDRGLVMSDLPAEIAGALPFLDYAAGQLRPVQVLIAGLGLGIVPAWLLAHASVARIDIIEIDADVIALITRGCRERGAPNGWAADPRLHIHHGDACTWWPGPADRRGCAVHGDCVLHADATWHAAFFDIWDGISPFNLPSMHRLTRRYARRVRMMWSWERAECEAMRARGQTLPLPYCFLSETGYPAVEG